MLVSGCLASSQHAIYAYVYVRGSILPVYPTSGGKQACTSRGMYFEYDRCRYFNVLPYCPVRMHRPGWWSRWDQWFLSCVNYTAFLFFQILGLLGLVINEYYSCICGKKKKRKEKKEKERKRKKKKKKRKEKKVTGNYHIEGITLYTGNLGPLGPNHTPHFSFVFYKRPVCCTSQLSFHTVHLLLTYLLQLYHLGMYDPSDKLYEYSIHR